MDRKCKRIISGKSYNTETATKLGGWEDNDEGFMQGADLYQNRLGAFFLHKFQDDGPDGAEEKIEPYTPEQAREWLEGYQSQDADLIESLFGKMPEAGSNESKFTLRIPDNLRERLAARARANGQSLNAWMVRCLENCAAPEEPVRKSSGTQ